MKKLIFTVFSLVALTVFIGTAAQAQQRTSHWSDDDDFNSEDDNPGVWSAIVREDKAFVRFGGLHWNSSSTFQVAELGTLPTGAAGTFVVKRDPGTVTFNGRFQDNHGHGTYAFVPDESFKAYLANEGFKDPSQELMLHLFFTNINKEYLGYMKQNGYDGLTIGQLRDLAYQNVNQKVMTAYVDLFKKEGYGKASIDQIIEMRNHGVTPSFFERFHEMGYKDITIDQAIELRDHGVDPEFIEEMKKTGVKEIPLDLAVELRDHGVTVEFIRGFHEAGYPDVSLEKAIELVDHGVTVEFIRGFQRLGFKNITPEEATELQDHGVRPSFVGRFKDLGYADITLDKARELQDHGVTPEYVKKLQDRGMKNLSLDECIRLRDVGM